MPHDCKLTKRQLEIRRREEEEHLETLARTERHSRLLEDGYVLEKANERQHPAHSDTLVMRIDALARYLGRGNVCSPRQATRESANEHADCGNQHTQTIRQCSESRIGGGRMHTINGRLCFRQMMPCYVLRLLPGLRKRRRLLPYKPFNPWESRSGRCRFQHW